MLHWEDQELNHATPETKFPEVFFAGLSLPMFAAKQRGKYFYFDQTKLNEMLESGLLTERALGVRIDQLCLHYRLFCRLNPGGDAYPTFGVMHFWKDSESLYSIFYFAPKNDWFKIMVVSGETATSSGT